MTYLLMIIISISIAFFVYSICQFIKIKGPCGVISLSIGLLFGSILFVTYPPRVSHETSNANVIIVGTSGDFPPFVFIENSEIVGFDIDLIKEMGKRLGKKIEIKNMPFNTLIPALQLGKIQVIAAGLTATSERAHNVFFTKPYIEGNPLIIVSRDISPVETITDLNNKEVIVNEGYTADIYMSQINGPILRRLKTVAEAFLALSSNRAIAFVTAKNAAQPFFDKHGTKGYHISILPNTDDNASLAVSQKYPELLVEIQSVLDSMKKDGFITNLRTKWGL